MPANRTLSDGFGLRLVAMTCTVWRCVRVTLPSHWLDRPAATLVASRSKVTISQIPLRNRRGDVPVMLRSKSGSHPPGFACSLTPQSLECESNARLRVFSAALSPG